jgi:hypothetical protein
VRLWIAFAVAGMLCGLSGAAAAMDSLDPDDARRDDDHDGLINLLEFAYGTDPTNPDTDGGGAPDGWEVYFDQNRAKFTFLTFDSVNYTLWGAYARYDSDGDGIYDVNVDPDYRFDPTCRGDEQDGCRGEVDSDHWSNLLEYRYGTDPTNPDTDKDLRMDDSDPEPLIPDSGRGPQCPCQCHRPGSGQAQAPAIQGAGMAAQMGYSWESF